jgi:hypothetical protein
MSAVVKVITLTYCFQVAMKEKNGINIIRINADVDRLSECSENQKLSAAMPL